MTRSNLYITGFYHRHAIPGILVTIDGRKRFELMADVEIGVKPIQEGIHRESTLKGREIKRLVLDLQKIPYICRYSIGEDDIKGFISGKLKYRID